ncbi:MAG: Crp/Fnr family transcriptional regulator [Agriterribacter sp.]
MNYLFNLFSSIYPLSEGLQDALIKLLKTKDVPKKSFLLRKGHVCNDIFFIEKGLFRCYYNANGKEICSWFMKENDIIISVESFFRRTASNEDIQSIEDSIVHYISHSELDYLYKNFPEFNIMGRVLTENYYTLSEQRLYSMRSQKAVERFEYLRTHFPEIIRRVPSGYIASYLGITIETLSRIKKNK